MMKRNPSLADLFGDVIDQKPKAENETSSSRETTYDFSIENGRTTLTKGFNKIKNNEENINFLDFGICICFLMRIWSSLGYPERGTNKENYF